MTRVQDTDHTAYSDVGTSGCYLMLLASGDLRSLDEHYLVSSHSIHSEGQNRTYIEHTLRDVMYVVHFTAHFEGHSTSNKRGLVSKGMFVRLI